MQDDPNDILAPGRVFGAYEIVRAIGDGSFGSVFEAFKLPLRRRVALKVLHAAHTSDTQIVGRFLREAESAAKLVHPHIVETYDVGVVDGMPFIAMEYLEGETLKSRLAREQRLAFADCADVILPVLSAAALMHEQNIVHRDLKPENIFLRQNLGAWQPKVLDFGVAKANDRRNLSVVGSRLGSPLYMSPEQHEGREADPRSDVWALGVIAFQCVTGVTPFPAKTLAELYRKVMMEPTPTIAALNPGVPPAFESAVLRALEKDPARRWQSAREMGAALFAFASPSVQHAMQHEFGKLITLSSLDRSDVRPPEETLQSTSLWTDPQPGLHVPASPVLPPVEPSRAAPSAPPPSRRLGIGLAIAALATLVVGLLVAVVITVQNGQTSNTPTVADAAPPVARRPLRVRVTPATATIQLDQESPVVGSLDRDLPGDDVSHTLRLAAPGHAPQSITFRAAAPPPEAIALAPLPPPPPPPPTEPEPTAPRRVTRPVERRPNGSSRRGVGNF
jgi:serine/threonine protein kinase